MKRKSKEKKQKQKNRKRRTAKIVNLISGNSQLYHSIWLKRLRCYCMNYGLLWLWHTIKRIRHDSIFLEVCKKNKMNFSVIYVESVIHYMKYETRKIRRRKREIKRIGSWWYDISYMILIISLWFADQKRNLLRFFFCGNKFLALLHSIPVICIIHNVVVFMWNMFCIKLTFERNVF